MRNVDLKRLYSWGFQEIEHALFAVRLSMRTIIRLNDLLRSAKRFAHETGQSLTKLIKDALRHTLARRADKPVRKPNKTHHSLGMWPPLRRRH